MTCVCGRPIVPGTALPWTHAVNPGRDHHYARPLRSASDSPDALGAERDRALNGAAALLPHSMPAPQGRLVRAAER